MEYINLSISIFTTLCIIVVGFVMNNKIQSLKDINSSMKAYMDIIKVDEIDKYVNMMEKSQATALKVYIKEASDKLAEEFVKDKEGYLKSILQNDIDKSVKNMDERFDELCDFIMDILIAQNDTNAVTALLESLPLNKEAFLEALKEQNS